MTLRQRSALPIVLLVVGIACSGQDESEGDDATSTGGTSIGGAASHSSVAGGHVTGGTRAGASDRGTGGSIGVWQSGGTPTQGTETGGSASGNGGTGGRTTSGSTTGGVETGDDGLGGNGTGGAATGGSGSGGRATGGSGIGGSTTGGGHSGGADTGGSLSVGGNSVGVEAGSGPGAGGAAGGDGVGGAGTGGSATGGSTGGTTATGGAETGGDTSGGAGAGGGTGENGWELVWSDEFDGTSIDETKWEHEVNCWGGGNNEDQCYVADAKNSFLEDGMLHIVAIDDSPSAAVGGPDDNPAIVTLGHSSARLRTMNRGDFRYGRIEARMKLPSGQGLWPAFWMLPTDSVYGGWAASGEIDIIEAVNLGPANNAVYGTIHYGGAWPDNTNSGSSTSPSGNAWESFHVYAVEWEEGEIRWFVDERHYLTQTEWRTAAGDFPAPFDQRFHILLNVAVGGSWPGPPDATTTFPQEMVVDYVRVYACGADPVAGHGCGTSDPSVQPL